MNRALPGCCRLYDVVGRVRTHDGITFVPALIDCEYSDEISFKLHRHQGNPSPPLLAHLMKFEAWDVLWVRARLAALFGFAPLSCASDLRTYFLEVPFVALHPRRRAQVFVLTNDEEHQAGLRFYRKQTRESHIAEVADSFWDLMLAQPEDFQPFDDFLIESTGDAIQYVHVGLDRNGFFRDSGGSISDSRNNVDLDRCDPHHGFGLSYLRDCDDCDGTGEEFSWPGAEACETCRGTGRVSWHNEVPPWIVRR